MLHFWRTLSTMFAGLAFILALVFPLVVPQYAYAVGTPCQAPTPPWPQGTSYCTLPSACHPNGLGGCGGNQGTHCMNNIAQGLTCPDNCNCTVQTPQECNCTYW